MNKNLKIAICTALITMLLMSVIFAGGVNQTIEVVFNAVNLTVNDTKVSADTILYSGTTYVPLRTIAEMLDKEVGWNQETYTASINDKITPVDISEYENEYIARDEDGKALYSLKINEITYMNERNTYSDKKPAQVLLIDYTYKNIASLEEVYIFDMSFKIIDSQGKIGYTYSNSIIYHPQRIPAGVTCDAQMIFGIDNESESVDLLFYENMFQNVTKTFKLEIEK